MSTLKTIAQQAIDRAGLEQQPPSEPNSRTLFDSNNKIIQSAKHTNEAHVPPLLGVAPLGPVPLLKEHQCQFQMMEAAYYHMPHPADSEKLRTYIARNQCQTPAYYQQVNYRIWCTIYRYKSGYVSYRFVNFICRHHCRIRIPLNFTKGYRLKHYFSYFIIWKEQRRSTLRPKLLKSKAGGFIRSI